MWAIRDTAGGGEPKMGDGASETGIAALAWVALLEPGAPCDLGARVPDEVPDSRLHAAQDDIASTARAWQMRVFTRLTPERWIEVVHLEHRAVRGGVVFRSDQSVDSAPGVRCAQGARPR